MSSTHRCRRVGCAFVVAALAYGAAQALSADYYFSSAGNDSTGDGSQANPWRSVSKFNQLDLNPGDNAYFRAGDQFTGRLYLNTSDSGVNASGQLVAPIKIGVYGSSDPSQRALIQAPANSEGFLAYNSAGIELSGLDFLAGSSSSGTRKSGISFYVDAAASAGVSKFEHIRVANVAAHGFADSGLSIYAESGVGYDDVRIADSEFYGNSFSGINVGASRWQDLIHANVMIDGVTAHDNPGASGSTPHSGHGIVVAQVDGAIVQNSVARDNGKSFGYGNVGIWAWQANNVVIQNNLAFGNRSPAGGDGGAFDLDGGVTNSLVQYNRSYDNDGAGLLLAQFGSAEAMSKNVFRYNLSINDGRGDYGGITVWGESAGDIATSAVFHNNTVVVDSSVVPQARGAVWFLNENHLDLSFFNNALVALNGGALIAGPAEASKAKFIGNAYWTDAAPIVLEDATYATVEAWAAAKNQERISGQFVGITGDPQFIDSVDFRPHAFSALVDASRLPGTYPWPAWIATLGPRDLEGLALFLEGNPEIGAYEVRLGDVNYDGLVDSADAQVLQAALNSDAAVQLRHDLDGDGDVDGAEFLIWQQRAQTAPSTTAGTVAPEPGGALIISSASAIGVAIRRQTNPVRNSVAETDAQADDATVHDD